MAEGAEGHVREEEHSRAELKQLSVAGCQLPASKRALEPILSPEGEKDGAPISRLTPGFSAERVGHPAHDEVLTFIERHRLMGRGIGWIDAHLLASAALSNTPLWSRERRLSEVAAELHLCAQP